MLRKTTASLFLLVILVLHFSCTNTEQKITKFVKAFNSVGMKPAGFNSAYAKQLPNKHIEITFQSEVLDDGDADICKGMSDVIVCILCKDISEFRNMIDEGVEFDIYFTSKSGSPLFHSSVNNKKIQRILDKNKG